MSATIAATTERGEPGRYDIRIQGHLEDRWADWFAGLALAREGDGTTTLQGPLADQAALHGVLDRIGDLGLPIISVQSLRPDETRSKIMKAIVYDNYGAPDVLRSQDVAKPTPKDNEVLIRVHAAAVTTTDCNLRGGDKLMRLVFGLRRPRKPILGTEFAGEIEATGKDVTRFKAGDQVFAATGAGFGAYAEYICLPEDGALARKPVNMTYEEAAAICEGGSTALPFLRDTGKIRPGHRVLINGASGAVGSAAVQLAKSFGADVTGVCGPTNVELVKSLGADTVIDYTQVDFTQTGQTYDIIFDAVGKSSFARCKGSLAPGGVYLATVPSLALYAHVLWTAKFGSKKARVAATGLRPARERANDLLVLKELTEAGKLRPVIDGVYPMEQIAEAHRRVETGHKKGHVVLVLA